MERSKLQKLVLSGMFMAIGIVLPFATMQLKSLGQMLSPMHLPALLCGLVCGPVCGAVVGFTVPLLRSVMFGMPKLFPGAVSMAFELMVYGIVSGYLYSKSRRKDVAHVYMALIPAMIIGRIVGGTVQAVLLGGEYTFAAFFAAYFINTMPGVIVQLVLIPIIMIALGKARFIEFNSETVKSAAEKI